MLEQLVFTANKLKQVEEQLKRAATLYNRRLQWLTSESRRVFGVIDEKAIVIVLDIKTMSPHDFDQYRSALERVIREQVSQLAKFNIVRSVPWVDVCVEIQLGLRELLSEMRFLPKKNDNCPEKIAVLHFDESLCFQRGLSLVLLELRLICINTQGMR